MLEHFVCIGPTLQGGLATRSTPSLKFIIKQSNGVLSMRRESPIRNSVMQMGPPDVYFTPNDSNLEENHRNKSVSIN